MRLYLNVSTVSLNFIREKGRVFLEIWQNGDLELENGVKSVIAGNDDKKDTLKVMTNISFQSYQQETEQHKNTM